MRRFLLIATLVLCRTQIRAQELRVPGEYSSIQSAITAADTNDTVIVAAGTYYENLNFLGKAIAVRSADPNDPEVVSATIIDGSNPVDPNIGSVVTFVSGEDGNSVLSGFTIRNGTGQADPCGASWYWKGTDGGGVFCRDASPTITKNVFRSCTAGYGGGAIYCHYQANPTIVGNTFVDNYAGAYGGAIFARLKCSPTISDNVFEQNQCRYLGGAVYLADQCYSKVTHNRFERNDCQVLHGGALYYFVNSAPIVACNLFIANTCSGRDSNGATGAAILMEAGTSGKIINNLFTGNFCHNSRGVVIKVGGYTTTDLIANNIVYANGDVGIATAASGANPQIFNNNVYQNIGGNYGGGIGDQTGINGNISADPQVGPELPEPFTCYELDPNSPCIDAGDNAGLPGWLTLDYDQTDRLVNGTVDMGPQEYHSIGVPQDFNTIQEAINNAESGDEIVVSPGFYTENVDFLDKNIKLRSLNPLDANCVAQTVIDGNGINSHSLALKADGSIVAWGDNHSGQATIPAGNDFTDIAAGYEHSLALKADGSIIAWGRNDYGQATAPVGNDFADIAAGWGHSLALKTDGSIVAWGRNDYGQATVPAGNDFTDIAAGCYHSLALKADGSIVAWGYNYFGQATAPAGNDFTDITAGEWHSLALKADGSIVAWGLSWGAAPAENDFIDIAAGWCHSLALKADGSIVAWGWNIFGQATAPAGNDFTDIAASHYHSFALKADGSIVAWGWNNHGQATAPAGNDFTNIAAGGGYKSYYDSSCIKILSGQNESTGVAGFRLENGHGEFGGGIHVGYSVGPVLMYNYITNNSADRYGGGVDYRNYAYGKVMNNTIIGNFASDAGGGVHIGPRSSCLIIDNEIINNRTTGEAGGGIYSYDKTTAWIIDNHIIGNIAETANGGGIWQWDSPGGVIEGNIIIGNTATETDPPTGVGRGGGIGFLSGATLITNNIICGNTADEGGGIWIQSSATCEVVNNTVAGNKANDGGGIAVAYSVFSPIVNNIVANNGQGGGVYVRSHSMFPSEPNLMANDVWANEGGNYLGDINDLTGIGGNICADPCFVEAGYWADNNTPDVNDDYWVGGDYHIGYYSPCRDAASSDNAPATDFDGNGRPHFGGIDIGAYELGVYDLTATGVVGFDDLRFLLNEWPSIGLSLPQDLNEDGRVDLQDFALLGEDWLR